MYDFELDALKEAARRPSPLDMPKVRITPDMLATRLAWTTMTGDLPARISPEEVIKSG